VFIISADFYFLLCQEQPVRTGVPTGCENLAILERTQFTPLLWFVLSNLTKNMRMHSEEASLSYHEGEGVSEEISTGDLDFLGSTQNLFTLNKKKCSRDF